MEYFSYQWHITDYCDQRCKHCYIFADKDINMLEMSFEQIEKTLESIEDMCRKESKKPYIYLTGGDPILHSKFWDIMKLFHKHNIAFGILGNPFHLTKEVCDRLKLYGCLKYQLSIDGMEKTHDFFRKPGSFAITLEKIKLLKDAGIKVAIMTTVSKVNIDEVIDIIDLVVDHEVNIFAMARYCPTIGDNSNNIEPYEYRDLLDKCWHKFNSYKDHKTSFNLKDHLWKLYLYEEGLMNIPDTLDDNAIYDGCHCGSHHMTIIPNGDIYACRRMSSCIGNVKEKSLYEHFYGNELNKYRQYDNFEKCSKCELKRFCRGCMAVAYGYTNNMYAPDPQCWKEISHE